MGTTANPYAERLANIGSSIGVFKNQADESNIFYAMIGIGRIYHHNNWRKTLLYVFVTFSGEVIIALLPYIIKTIGSIILLMMLPIDL